MPWLEDLKFPRGYQMGTHKRILILANLHTIIATKPSSCKPTICIPTASSAFICLTRFFNPLGENITRERGKKMALVDIYLNLYYLKSSYD